MHRRCLLLFTSSLLAAPNAFAQPTPEPPQAPPAEAAPNALAQPAPEPAPAPPAEPAPAPPAEPAPAAEAPAAPPAAAAPAAAPAADQPAEPEPPAPKKMHVGKEGFFQPSALLQGWFWVRQDDDAANNQDWNTTFRLRRAELRIKGEIIPEFMSYAVMIDPAKLLNFVNDDVPVENQEPAPVTPGTVSVPQPPRDTSILQDFYITFISDYADVSIGQFKIPVSYEGVNSASKLLMPERSRVSREYGDRRDMGLRVEKKFEYFGYMAGVFNGEGQGRLDANDAKDVSLRLEAYPMEGLLLGVVGYRQVGERTVAETTGAGASIYKDRLEGDLRIEIAHALLQAEYIHGWGNDRLASRAEGHGAYGALGYTFFDHLQPLVRIGFLNDDLDTAGYDMIYEAGINYYFLEHEAKLQLMYGLTNHVDLPDANDHEVILAGQIAF